MCTNCDAEQHAVQPSHGTSDERGFSGQLFAWHTTLNFGG